ncbi:MAG TPA: endonuclease/exonuclease/phosphatase family protein [Cyclobacteriaceae bacterium]|nr:endonuclease/exonuclease/phosphatase family protein [Cyclobacteriaceae bacterium]
MKLLFILILIAADAWSQPIPIAQARKLKAGTIVTVAGNVTVSKELGDLSFIQDRTGGIAIYSEAIAVSVVRGDSIVVTGKLSKFNGLLEILSDSVRKIAGATRLMAPKDINLKQAADYEGQLVRVSSVLLKPPEHFFYPQRAGIMVKGPDTLNYWIDGDTNIPGYSIPTSPVSITGVVGRFKDHCQLIPRSVDDLPGAGPPMVARNDNRVAIMNWNLEFLGASSKKYGAEYGPPNETLQVANAGRLLTALHPDIIALQEISDDAAFRDLVRTLSGYEGRCSSRYSYSFDASDNFPPQKLCFVYKMNTVKLIREKILFRKEYDEALPPATFASGRLPYLLEAEVTSNGQTKRIFIINIHGKSGASPDDRTRRAFDARLLKDTLDEYYRDRNVIILGDLNDDLDVSIAGGRESPYAPFVNDMSYRCISKQLSDNGWHSTISYDDVIDHQILSSALATGYVDGSAKIVNPFGLIERYGESTSDHLPVMSEFDFGSEVITEIVTPPPGLCVFPNPNGGEFQLVCPGNFEYRLIGSTRACLENGSGFDHITSGMLTNHPSGVYTLLITKGTRTHVVRLVKQ